MSELEVKFEQNPNSIKRSCMNVFFFYEEVDEGFLLHTIQRAKPPETRRQSWVLRAGELHHGKSHWGGRSLEQSPLEQDMMGTWGDDHRADRHITLSAFK